MRSIAELRSALHAACASLTGIGTDRNLSPYSDHASSRAKRTWALFLSALWFVPSVSLAGWLYVAEGDVLTANTIYEGGSIAGPTGPLRVSVKLPASYVPGTTFDESDEVIVDIRGPGNFNFHLAEPMEGEMPVDAGPGSFMQDPTLGDPLGMRAPGPFIWAMEFYCPVPTPGACRGYEVTGELSAFRLLSEPTMYGVLVAMALAGVAARHRGRKRGLC